MLFDSQKNGRLTWSNFTLSFAACINNVCPDGYTCQEGYCVVSEEAIDHIEAYVVFMLFICSENFGMHDMR